jgi:hypothetical protein
MKIVLLLNEFHNFSRFKLRETTTVEVKWSRVLNLYQIQNVMNKFVKGFQTFNLRIYFVIQKTKIKIVVHLILEYHNTKFNKTNESNKPLIPTINVIQ